VFAIPLSHRMASSIDNPRPSYLAAGIVTAAIFALYAITLAPTVAMWDAGEYIAAAYTFGTPHPPGNPLFVMLGRTFSILPIAPTPAQRMNLMSAIASALSAGVWFLIAERATRNWLRERWQRIAVGTVAAIVSATAFTVWNQSVVSEKVYMITLVIFAAIAWLMVLWADDPDAEGADRKLLLAAYLIGLGYANHMGGILAAPGVAVAVLMIRPRAVLRPRLLATGAAALVLGLTPFVMQPLRAPHFPEINMGETTGCLTEMNTDCVMSQQTLTLWKQHLDRSQYPKPKLLERQVPFAHQVGMWWLYFKWQWLRDLHMQYPAAQTGLAVLFLGLGLFGGYVHYQRDRKSFWFFGPFVFSVTLLFVFLLNFKLGWTQARLDGMDPSLLAEVRDRDYFFVWGYSALGVWIALALATIWAWAAAALARGKEGARTRIAWLAASPALMVGLLPLVLNSTEAPRNKDTVARDWAIDMLNSVEPYGVLITGGDNDTYPLWYVQEVEGIRRDVTVAVTSLLNTDWYVRQMIRRPIYPYDVDSGPAVYRNREWPKPDGPPIDVAIGAVEQTLPPYIMLREAAQMRKDSLVATLQPGVVSRDQLVVLSIIKDSFPERPLYIARSAGGYGEQLGLDPYMLTQGMARKVMPSPVQQKPGIALIQGEGWVDVQRSAALWNDYRGTTALARLDDWMDRATTNIPFIYVNTGVIIAEGLARQGDTTQAQAIYKEAEAIAETAQLQALFARGGG
jgi:hypothetical protein